MKRLLVLSSFVAIVAACSSPDEGARVSAGKLPGPDDPAFASLSAALVYNCGTLDCHGSLYRNLRLYGYGGLRLEATRSDQGSPTLPSPAELARNYEALMGLEPEKMAEVIREGGRAPERLTLVRKARATENHKGGPVVRIGDPVDRCLTSWLTGTIDEATCRSSDVVPWFTP